MTGSRVTFRSFELRPVAAGQLPGVAAVAVTVAAAGTGAGALRRFLDRRGEGVYALPMP